MKIDNLAVTKDLAREEMEAIVGGSVFENNAINANLQAGGVSFASPQTNIAPVTQVDASTHTDVDLKEITKSVSSVGSLIQGMKI
ncbi:hypothetical protein [Caballeronia sp. LZ035]|uniref:hypothetical protein n=1 Tax=Caballeronia sp. LZ035 TaxID=3038568 RepID=UPI002860A631|nr:hypothetical protein [Caballeronia sp. LZ035]MDR5760904.1 hypothetical protein [Caballeronia sp. LZ035]